MSSYNQKFILNTLTNLLNPVCNLDESLLPASQKFWDELIKLGSGHLILPAIYGSIKRKKLNSLIPEDLMSFLKEIYFLNKNRNKAILKQINFLNNIFKNNDIEHVFLKGSAILILKPFDAISERMIGDIDVLIKKEDLLKAQSILGINGFSSKKEKDLEFIDGLDGISKKHLHRMVSPDFIAAVELHSELLDFDKSIHFPAELVIRDIIYHNSYPIPSRQNLWKHAIFNWQYNDFGMAFNQLSLRTFIDVLYLEPKNINDHLNKDSAISHFYSLCSLFVDSYPRNNYWSYKIYKYTLINSKFRHTCYILAKFKIKFSIIINRLNLAFTSKIYRKHLLENPNLLFKKIYNFLKKN